MRGVRLYQWGPSYEEDRKKQEILLLLAVPLATSTSDVAEVEEVPAPSAIQAHAISADSANCGIQLLDL